MELPTPVPLASAHRRLLFRPNGGSEFVSGDFADTMATRDGTVITTPATDAVIGGAETRADTSSSGGERHLDGDELLLVTDGAMRVWFETDDGRQEEVPIFAGEAIVVPRRVWHGLVVEGRCSYVWFGAGRTERRPG
jgi:mannose-6-phosphate isomerase-like protein (cupin superfamily)